MNEREPLALLEEEGALLSGHFLLTTGLHSPTFLQCARLMEKPSLAEALAAHLVHPLPRRDIERVAGPAVGGIILAHEVARALGVRSTFAEKDGEGGMRFRRGFVFREGERVLVVEDAVTTGGSVLKVLEAVRKAGAEPVAVAALVDRSGGRVDFGVPFVSLWQLDIPSYRPAECPLCQEGVDLIRPKD